MKRNRCFLEKSLDGIEVRINALTSGLRDPNHLNDVERARAILILDNASNECAWARKHIVGGKDDLAKAGERYAEMFLNQASWLIAWPLIETGEKIREAARLGGRRKDCGIRRRDIEIAREFENQRATASELSDWARKLALGKKHGLKKSAAVAAVDRGLKILSGERGKPDK